MSEARVPVNIAILTISDTRDESTDKSGKLISPVSESAFCKFLNIAFVY